jgi:cell division protein FtsI/penicillin-binding protein 2
MLRRRAISLLLGAVPALASRGSGSLDRFLDPELGCALLLGIRDERIIASNSSLLIDTILAPPGSTLKPFTLAALLRAGKLPPDTSFPCPERLTLGGRRLDCSHPRMLQPIRIDTALAYSCNCFVAHAAERFQPGELARALQPEGFGSPGAVLRPTVDGEAQQLQSLGEGEIMVTPAGLARAYRLLALRLTRSGLQPGMPEILAGLEGAVEFGTAQLAGVRWATLAGKTGSTRRGAQFIGWFAGFVPSRAPEATIVVMLAGRHGGSDAAPVASQILNAWHAGRI